MKEWKVVLAALIIFASGVVTGGLTVRLSRQLNQREAAAQRGTQTSRPASQTASVVSRHEAQVRDLMRRMEKTLELTPEQHDRIQELIAESQRRMQKLFQEVAPRTREEVRALHGRIRTELRPEQQREFDRLARPPARLQEGLGTSRYRPETGLDPVSSVER